MRSILARAVGLSLGVGGLLGGGSLARAQYGPANEMPAVSLGRPVPAASLGRPSGLSASGDTTFQPAGFRPERPMLAPSASADSAPLLAPVFSTPGAEPAPAPRALPSDGGSSASPPGVVPGPALPAGPTYGPAMPYPYPGVPGGETGGCASNACAPRCGFLGCCDPSVSGFGNRCYASADFLLFWVPTISTPLPLALSSTVPYTGPNLPPTTVAIGSTDLINNIRIGGRFDGGVWFDPCHLRGLEAGFFFLGPASRDLVATTSAAFPTLLRPYIVINPPLGGNPPPVAPPGQPNFADDVGNPGIIRVHTDSFLMGADVNYRRQLYSACGASVDLLLGFRYMHLDENLTITETGTRGAVTGSLSDRFRTVNNFYGYQIGMIARKQWGPWSADLTMKMAAGNTYQIVDISGSNTVDVARPNVGLFAQTSNIGRYDHLNFSVVPEVGLKLGYQWTPHMALNFGYSAIYWSNVLRPGDQIDPIIDQTRVPGAPAGAFGPLNPADPHPVIPFRRSDYYAHGLSFGVTFTW